ncbi:MAG: TSUP family transporter [Thermoplasmata archaeon]
MDPLSLLAALGIGAAAGLLSGMFGIGGGIVMVPGLLFAGLVGSFSEATACSLFAIIFVSPMGSYVHMKARHLNLRYALALGASGVLGGVAGSYISSPAPQNWLELAFGIFALVMGVELFLNSGRGRGTGVNNAVGAREGGAGGTGGAKLPCGRDARRRGSAAEVAKFVEGEERQPAGPGVREPTECRLRNPYPVLVLLGLAAGLLAGFLGVGGGLVMVPVMVLLGVGVHVAIGTSLLAILFTACASVAAKASLSHFDIGVAVPLAIGGCVAAWAGAVAAERTGSRQLSRYVSVLQFVIGGYMLAKGLGLL